MSQFNSQITENDVKLTPGAREQMIRLLGQVDDDDIRGVRIFVSGGGCGGMTYGMTFTDQQSPYDCVLDDGDIRVHVDSVALNYLRGVEIDYVDRPMGASFVFNNVFQSTGGTGACKACGSTGGGCG